MAVLGFPVLYLALRFFTLEAAVEVAKVAVQILLEAMEAVALVEVARQEHL
jgi:hypothetical protein